MAFNFPNKTAVVSPQLFRNKKLRKVLRELHVNSLTDSTSHKCPKVYFVCKYIDLFAESDSDVGKTSLTIY